MSGPDFALTPEQSEFRQELERFIRDEVSEEELSSPQAHADEHSPAIYEKLAAKGWLGMNIPEEFGGEGRGAVDLTIFREVTAYYRVPIGGFTAGSRVGHALHLRGSEEQCRRFLPPLVRGELLMSIGYTEPESGSDLASLRTRAVPDHDGYSVSGQKIFTTAGHLAHWIFLACRTDPDATRPHRGISVFLVDLRSPGVRIDPIWTLGGWRLNTIFFDDVHVPTDNLVGDLNNGWSVIRTALAVERTGIQPVSLARRALDDLWDITQHSPELLVMKPAEARVKLSEQEAEIEAARWLAYRLAWEQDQGRISVADSATSKLLGGEAYRRTARLTSLLLGADLFVTEPRNSSKASGLEREYRYAPQATIAAGTSEVMRNIIAQHALKLPIHA